LSTAFFINSNRMKKGIFFLGLFCICYSISAQDIIRFYGNKTKKVATNSFFIELGGNSAYYSFNYDKLFYISKSFKMSYRIGASLNTFSIPKLYEDNWHLSPRIPLEINFLFGKRQHHLETSFGYCPYFYANNLPPGHSISYRLGYRYQIAREGLFIRAGALLIVDDSGNLFPWGGIGIGKSFKYFNLFK